MRAANWHTFQVLTKRPSRMRDLLQMRLAGYAGLPHVWWGVSVENRKDGLPRIEHLRQAPARMGWLSVEPLLEDVGVIPHGGIAWVVVGGESGPGARPLDPAGVRSVREQCRAAGWEGTFKGKTGRTLDGQTHDEFPPVLPVAVPPGSRRVELVEEFRG